MTERASPERLLADCYTLVKWRLMMRGQPRLFVGGRYNACCCVGTYAIRLHVTTDTNDSWISCRPRWQTADLARIANNMPVYRPNVVTLNTSLLIWTSFCKTSHFVSSCTEFITTTWTYSWVQSRSINRQLPILLSIIHHYSLSQNKETFSTCRRSN